MVKICGKNIVNKLIFALSDDRMTKSSTESRMLCVLLFFDFITQLFKTGSDKEWNCNIWNIS